MAGEVTEPVVTDEDVIQATGKALPRILMFTFSDVQTVIAHERKRAAALCWEEVAAYDHCPTAKVAGHNLAGRLLGYERPIRP